MQYLQAKDVDVDEWNESSRGKKLPHKVQEPISEIRALAKKAAQIKQASILGGVLRQGTQAIKTVLPKIKPAVSNFLRPAIKPDPKLVVQNAAKPTGAGTRALNYVANVPKGETFLQRPISNTKRLLTFDGIPGMRRVGQASIAGIAGTAGYNAYQTHNALMQDLDKKIDQVSTVTGIPTDIATNLKQHKDNIIYSGYKRIAAVPYHRYVTGYPEGPQGQAQRALDNITAQGVNDLLKYKLQQKSKPENSILSRILHHRNPVSMGLNSITNYLPSLIERNLNYGTPAQYEQELKNLVIAQGSQTTNDVWNLLTPAQRQILVGIDNE